MKLRSFTRKIRLLPAVMIAGTALLGMKGFGLVHGALAQTQPATQIAANLSSDGIAAPHDIASDDDNSGSAAEADVLTSLAKRRAELDARARDQAMRENVLAATEKRVDAKIAALKLLQIQMTTLLGERDAAQDKQVASLVKTYSSMKPKDAARIFDGLSDDVLVPVAQSMKSDALAPVLAAMNPQSAQKLTVKLASRLTLPEKAVVAPPVPVPAAAAPGLQAPSAITPPAQQAAAEASKVPAPQAQAQQAVAPQGAAPQPTTPSKPNG
jgi:flagellar motility protein MotE (MotC chaperone)